MTHSVSQLDRPSNPCRIECLTKYGIRTGPSFDGRVARMILNPVNVPSVYRAWSNKGGGGGMLKGQWCREVGTDRR